MGEPQVGRLSPTIPVVLLVGAILLLAGAVYCFGRSQPALMALNFLPVLAGGYWFGRRGGLLTAVGSIVLVAVLALHDGAVLAAPLGTGDGSRWLNLMIWGASLLLAGYAAGRLFEGQRAQVRELHEAYWGFLPILNMFVNKDEYSQKHAQRVSVYAGRIAEAMGLAPDRVEDVRAAALVRDLGKVELTREVLAKAAQGSEGAGEPRPAQAGHIGGTLRRILPILLAETAPPKDAAEGGPPLPLEARILAVADVYASLTADRPYRKAMSANDAKDVIVRGAGREFDQEVVTAFERAFADQQMEVREESA